MSAVAMYEDMPDPHIGRVWRSDRGTIHGIMSFGNQSWPYLTFDSPAEARAHAAVAIEIAEAMERLEAESPALPAKGEGAGDGRVSP